MRIKLDNEEIKFFDLNTRGKIVKSGDHQPTTWDRVHVDLDNLEVGKPPRLTFNKSERESIGKEPVFTNLNYCVTEIIK